MSVSQPITAPPGAALPRPKSTWLSWVVGGLAAFAVCGSFLQLGTWQVDRAEMKSARIERFDSFAQAAPVALSRIDWRADNLYRRIAVSGHFRAQPLLFLDNQMRAGRSGLLLYSALQTDIGTTPLIVERGWIERDPRSREQLPVVTTPSGQVELTGTLSPPPSAGLELGTNAASAGPYVLSTRVEQRELALLGGNLAGALILKLDPAQPGAYAVEPRPTLGMAPDRHRAYAFQWRALAAGLACVYLILLFRRYVTNRSP